MKMTLAQGDTVGSYEIINQVGQGGMATVYKAYHPQLDRHVAVKIIHQSFLEDENFVARFQREAQIVARLDHPNIVPVYDFNSHQGQPFLVMKFIEGVTLKTVLSQNQVSFDRLVNMMQAVASALSYAHSRGVLHRDMKPSNILVDHEQRPYITDFGLARLVQAGASTLSQDMLLGTPHYISPEQARGEQELGPATDIYSLGVILYEITVGRVPFTGNTPYSIVHDHIFTPLPLPTELNPEIPPALEQVLLRALAKSPQDRYRSAVEMLEAFQSAAVETGFKTGQLKPHVAGVKSVPNINSPSAKPVITIPAAAPTGSAVKRVVVVKSSRSSRKNWLWAMLIVLGLIAITLLAIIGSIMSNAFQEVSSMVETRLPTLAVLLEDRATAF
jgi:serine/threonine-protein kinase